MSRLLTFPPTQPPCSSLSSSSQVTLQTSLSPVVTRLSPFHFLLPPDQLQSPPDLSSLFQSPGYSSPSSILLPSSLSSALCSSPLVTPPLPPYCYHPLSSALPCLVSLLYTGYALNQLKLLTKKMRTSAAAETFLFNCSWTEILRW